MAAKEKRESEGKKREKKERKERGILPFAAAFDQQPHLPLNLLPPPPPPSTKKKNDRVTQTRAFDTEAASSSYATGFVVDAARGVILTNRHVVTPGPVTSEAIFLNREEVPVRPLYYDPVHDFGFLGFDPSKLQFMKLGQVRGGERKRGEKERRE